LNIFIRSGDIRRQTSKLTEIRPNFACFWPLKIFLGGSPKILDWDYKIERSTKHRAKSADGARRLRGEKKKKKNHSKTEGVVHSLLYSVVSLGW